MPNCVRGSPSLRQLYPWSFTRFLLSSIESFIKISGLNRFFFVPSRNGSLHLKADRIRRMHTLVWLMHDFLVGNLKGPLLHNNQVAEWFSPFFKFNKFFHEILKIFFFEDLFS